MTLTVYILIAIPICILAILIWTYFDYRKYKREHHLIILLSLLFPTLSHAQYIDNENCRISFKSYENHQDKLEYIKDNVFYQFIPNSSAWKVIIKNNTDEVVWLNWEESLRRQSLSFYNRQSSYGKHSKQSWNKPYNHRIQPDYPKRD